MTPPITVEQLIGRYAVLLLDAYGVLVSSAGALTGAADLIDRLNHDGKPYFVVTNDASKLPATAARRYRGFGLAIDEAGFITSGSSLHAPWQAAPRDLRRGAPAERHARHGHGR
jgi:ribonucleotide monophosphatase NagD (HAD superfamily)